MKYQNVGGIGGVDIISDAHLIDERGMSMLHWALEKECISPSFIAKLLNMVHPHVMTYDGLTPLDQARKELKHSEGSSKF